MRSVFKVRIRGLKQLSHDDAELAVANLRSTLEEALMGRLQGTAEWRVLDAMQAGSCAETDCDAFSKDEASFRFASHYPAAFYIGPHWYRLGLALFRERLAEQLSSLGLELADPAEDAGAIAAEETSEPLVVLRDDVVVVHEEYEQTVGVEIEDFAGRPASELDMLRAVARARRCCCAVCRSLRQEALHRSSEYAGP
jgi:hypothetical protein